jgi:carboxypeptidase Taq
MGEHYNRFMQRMGEITDLEATRSVLEWDQQTQMPPRGADGRANLFASIGKLFQESLISEEFASLLEKAKHEQEAADPDSNEARILAWTDRYLKKRRKIPIDWVADFEHTTALAFSAWEKSRAETDFAHFQPHLERIYEMAREFAEFYAPYEHVYDPLFDRFEPEMKTAQVKQAFDNLRPQQVELVKAIQERKDHVDDSLLYQNFDKQGQWEFTLKVVEALGFDFEHGRQDISTHPFTIHFGRGDVRLTTRINPGYLGDAVFSSMHEAGHGIHAQGVGSALDRTLLTHFDSHGIAESQSRLFENLIGRSHAFWKAFYPDLKKIFPAQLNDVDVDAFYRAVNQVEPSLIRTEADEATYNLHIMLRFDLELALLEGTLVVADLPTAWNDKMQEYLGVTPPNDAKGVLQDVHWSGGSIGYFPTYSLGNLMASQIWEKMESEIPDLVDQIEQGKLSDLVEWLRVRIHDDGPKYDALELLERVTGQVLSPEPYLRYLRRKYGELYEL